MPAFDWSLDIADGAPSTLYRYPASLAVQSYGGGGYIRPTIHLEFGGRNEVWPAAVHAVRPYCLEEFPTLSARPSCDVTFWRPNGPSGKSDPRSRRISSARVEPAS